MPRSKNQKHHHWRPDPAGDWDIDDPHKFLAKDGGARSAVGDYMKRTGLRQPQAVAELLMAGYAQLVSTARGGRGQRNGDGGWSGQKPDRAGGRGRVDGNRYEQSGPEKHRSPDSEAA